MAAGRTQARQVVAPRKVAQAPETRLAPRLPIRCCSLPGGDGTPALAAVRAGAKWQNTGDEKMQEEEVESEEVRSGRMATLLDRLRSISCCAEFLAPRNKVLPHSLEPLGEDGVQYVEPSPGRRLRVLCARPSTNSPGSKSSDVGDKATQQVEDEGELSEEEYWFESAAPNRLPVIQPLPPPPQSRIINKFEPREPANAATLGSPLTKAGSPGDCISPGRLPRKKLGSRVLEEEEDDYEDEERVDSTTDLTPSSPQQPPASPQALAVLGQMSDMILEITADSTSKLESGGGGRLDVTPPCSPDPLADDSCHPSPEVPHRTVCASPDPDSSAPVDFVAGDSLTVMGGNLGGMANQGFSPDEDEDGEDDNAEGSDTETIAADEQDAGFARNRDLLDTLDSIAPLPEPTTTPASSSLPAAPEQSSSADNLPLLFFLHGVGGSADIWSNQFNHFSRLGFTCVAPDMLGHGFSACPDSSKAYTFSRLFKDVLAIFDAFVPEERRAVVFGHSYGCSFSVALARTRPERVTTLILVAGGGPTPLAPPPNSQTKTGAKWAMALLRRILECKARGSHQKYNPRGKSLRFREAYDVPSYVLQHVMTGQIWPEGDAGFHRRVTVPTLLVYGMRDCLVSLVEECEMERTLPKSYLELVPGAGHAVMLDTPTILNTMTERFINKWTTKSKR